MIDNRLIPYIEKALGFELYPLTIQYLTKDFKIPYDKKVRRIGRTTAYIIKFILENYNSSIDLNDLKCGKYIDESWDNAYTNWFYNEFMDIRHKLKGKGLKVVDITYKGKLIE